LLLCWLTEETSAFVLLSAAVSAGRSLFGFILLLLLWFFNQLLFQAGRYKIPAHQQALFVGGNYI
jgi:hypothetical protein